MNSMTLTHIVLILRFKSEADRSNFETEYGTAYQVTGTPSHYWYKVTNEDAHKIMPHGLASLDKRCTAYSSGTCY